MRPSETERAFRQRISTPQLLGLSEDIWDMSREQHEAVTARQMADGHGSDNGRDHCLRVEDHLDYMEVHGGKLEPPLNDCERFLLSVSACCHDFGKALTREQLQRDYNGNHGDASAVLLGEKGVLSRLESPFQAILRELIVVHSLPAAQLHRIFEGWLRDPNIGAVPIRQMLLELLLRYADFLDLTYSRIRGEETEGVKENQPEQVRRNTWGFAFDGTFLVLTAKAESAAEKHYIEVEINAQRKADFDPLCVLLPQRLLPTRLQLDVRAADETQNTDEDSPALGAEPTDAQQESLAAPQSLVPSQPATLETTPHLAAAARSLRLASAEPSDQAQVAAARDRLATSSPAAYWFVSSITTADWLTALGALLRVIVSGQDSFMLDAAFRALHAVASREGRVVLSSGLVDCLWDGPTTTHRHAAVRVIHAAGAWRTPLGERVLETVLDVDRQLSGLVVILLTGYCQEHPEQADFILDWLLDASERAREKPTDGHTNQKVFDDYNIRHIAERSPAAVLRHVLPLIKNDLGTDSSKYLVEMQLRRFPGAEWDPLLVHLRDLIAQEIKAPNAGNEAIARRAARRLSADEDPSLRTIGCSAILHSLPRSQDLAVAPLAESATWLLSAHDLVEVILSKTYPKMSAANRERVDEAILAIPFVEKPGWEGYRRHQALTAIPEGSRSERVAKEIARLEVNSEFRTRDRATSLPAPIEMVAVPEPDLPDLDDAVTHPDILEDTVARLEQLDTVAEYGAQYPIQNALEAALSRNPQCLLPLTAAIAHLDRPRYDQLIPAVASYLHSVETGADELLDLALKLPSSPGSSIVDALTYSLPKQPGTLSANRRAELATLLSRWADDELSASTTDVEEEQQAGAGRDLVNVGINTTAGRLAHCLAVFALQKRGSAAFLAALRRLAPRSTPSAQAVILWTMTPFVRSRHKTLLPLIRDLLTAPTASLFGVGGHTLRGLPAPAAYRIGDPLVERFMDSENEDAQAAIGLLAGVWAIRDDDQSRAELLKDVLHNAGQAARRLVGTVMAANTVGQDEHIMARARKWCGDLLPTDDTALRTGMLKGWQELHDRDVTPVLGLMRDTFATNDKATLDEAMNWIRFNPETINQLALDTMIEAILDTPLASAVILQHSFLQYGAGFTSLYTRLLKSGRRDLALRLLDAAALYGAEAARPQIARYAAQVETQEGV